MIQKKSQHFFLTVIEAAGVSRWQAFIHPGKALEIDSLGHL
jgi:hypothetical protein